MYKRYQTTGLTITLGEKTKLTTPAMCQGIKILAVLDLFIDAK